MMNQSMSVQKAAQGVLATKATEPFEQAIEAAMGDIKMALPKHIEFSSALQIFKNLRTKDPKLALCTRETLIGAMLTAAECGLRPVYQQCFFIPFKNGYKSKVAGKDVFDCQLQIGYQGLLELCYRNDRVISIEAKSVKEGDEFDYEEGKEPVHKPKLKGLPGPTYGYYAIAKLRDGGVKVEYMSRELVEVHAKSFVKSKDDKGNFVGPWKDHFDEMAKKTVLKKLLKTLPKSTDLEKALEADDSVREYRKGTTSMFALPKDDAVHRIENTIPADFTVIEPDMPENAPEVSNSGFVGKPAEVTTSGEKASEIGKETPNTPIVDVNVHLLELSDSEKDAGIASKGDIMAFVASISEKEQGEKKSKVTYYSITDSVDESSSMFKFSLSMWGYHPKITIGKKVKFIGVEAKLSKDKWYYSAKTYEVIG